MLLQERLFFLSIAIVLPKGTAGASWLHQVPPVVHRLFSQPTTTSSTATTQRQVDDPNSIEGRTAIGYWSDDISPLVDKDWNPQEKLAVMAYLQQVEVESQDKKEDASVGGPVVLRSWRGLATCRVCDEILGNECHGDDTYNWPQGYLHSIKEHNVKPPQEFIDHVLLLQKKKQELESSSSKEP